MKAEIGKYCKEYRNEVLHMTLKEVAGSKYKSLWAFENGKSSNLKYLAMYLEKSNPYQSEIFLSNIRYEMVNYGKN